jgi:hypothetical protein
VLMALCEGNMVGNGSNPLMRAEAVRQVGGYDSSLISRSAQGCEDWALYLAIAEHFQFAVVPEYLTGYRVLPRSMSSDLEQMWRSFCLVEESVRSRRPDLRRHLQEGLANMCYACYRRARRKNRTAEARAHLHRLLLKMPYHAMKIFIYRPLRQVVRRQLGEEPATAISREGRRFPVGQPPERGQTTVPGES